MKKLKTLIIIGGTGFFGKSILDYGLKNTLYRWKIDKVICFSRKVKTINISNKKLSVKNVYGDISKIKKIPESEYIIYAANSDNKKENLNGFYNFPTRT